MKLLLTSEGITNNTIKTALLDLLGKPFEKSRAVHIPTAANGEPDGMSGAEIQIEGTRALKYSSVDVVDISKDSKEVWLPVIEKADILVIGGGNTTYLLSWLFRSGLVSQLPRLLTTKVYMGISAGSIAAAKTVSLSSEEILYYEKTGNLGRINGLSLVDFEIRPHLNSSEFPKMRIEYLERLSHENTTPFYAIDDNYNIF
jgi:dipeptidase E